MPSGTALLLGRVLLMYWHKLTRLVRNLMYLDVALIDEPLIINGVVLSDDDLADRKCSNYLEKFDDSF